ncbi:hypothetical protein MAR_029559 [Mya arenaria]|uniref:Uncharacterized protein n=1 Tax=Mya arenaria TaxID=6604 RepID=A0ABY7DGP7_MYAAR|nr:hypothetical protein MAR_029559 [Mya arenaria]
MPRKSKSDNVTTENDSKAQFQKKKSGQKIKRSKCLRQASYKSRSRKVVKKLEMSNAILAEVRDAVQKTKSQSERGVIMRVIIGKILKKYKCLDTVRKQTGLGRKGMTMRSAKLEILPNPETVGKTINMDGMMDILSKLDDSEKVTFEKWQRVNDDDDSKKRMKIILGGAVNVSWRLMLPVRSLRDRSSWRVGVPRCKEVADLTGDFNLYGETIGDFRGDFLVDQLQGNNSSLKWFD